MSVCLHLQSVTSQGAPAFWWTPSSFLSATVPCFAGAMLQYCSSTWSWQVVEILSFAGLGVPWEAQSGGGQRAGFASITLHVDEKSASRAQECSSGSTLYRSLHAEIVTLFF